jgi:hypothetical protein
MESDTGNRLLRNELSSALHRFRQDFLLRRAQAHVQVLGDLMQL